MGRGRGNVKVYIEGDAGGLDRASKAAESTLGRLGGRVESVGKRMSSAGDSLTKGVTLPIVAVGTVAGKAAIDFDKSMRNVNSIAQLPQPQLEKLESRVLGLAGPTAQAPVTLSEGLYDLVSSGFESGEAMGVLDKSARAATAGLTTTEVSTEALAAVLNAYHLEAREAGTVSDQLFETVNRGVITFPELATTIGDVLPFASSLNVGLDQVGASVATMTKQGIQAPETMTRIKNVMVSLIKPGEALAGAIEDTGFQSGEALVKQKGFQDGLEALVGTTDGSKEAIAELFPNIRALGGVLALTGKNSQGAEQDLRAFGDTSGATAKATAQQSESLSYQWGRFKAELTATAVKAAPDFIDAGKEVISTLGDITEGIDDLSPATKTTMIKVALAGAALGPVLSIGGRAVTMLGKFITLAGRAGSAAVAIGSGEALAGARGGIRSVFQGVKGALMNERDTYALARSFGRGRLPSMAAAAFSSKFVQAVGPAIAVAGVGNVIASAVQGDTKDAAFKAGGAIAGALAGGIAGSFLGNPALGAMLGGGLGSFVGGIFGDLFDSEQKLTPMQERLERTAEAVGKALRKQARAGEDLQRSQERLDGANGRHKRATSAVRRAQDEYQRSLQKFGPKSLPALQAALRLARAQRQEKRAAEEAKKAHKLNGIQLELFRTQTTRAVAAENRRIPVLRRTVNDLTGKWRAEKDNVALQRRLEEKVKSLNKSEGHRSRIIEEASQKVNPRFARSLENMGRVVSRVVGESGKLRTELRRVPPDTETVAEGIRKTFAGEGALSQAIRSFKERSVKGDLKQKSGRLVEAFRDQGAGAFGELAERVYEADKNIVDNTSSMAQGFGATEMPEFKLVVPVTKGKGKGRARGGTVARVAGKGRRDTVPITGTDLAAMVAPGEDLAVFTRHQRPLVDRALANEYGVSGLPGFFSAFDRPHYFARGGLPHPAITGPDPGQDIGQGAVDRGYKAARKWLAKHSAPPRVRDMVQFAVAEARKGYPYVYGGGHASFAGPYDCSGYVSAILHAGRFLSSPMSVQQGSGLYTFGEAGPGRWVTWGVRGTSGANAHTMIGLRVGNRTRYFESGSGHGASEVGGWSGSFKFRHPPNFARGGLPLAVRDALARHGREALDPSSPHFVGWGYAKGGVVHNDELKAPPFNPRDRLQWELTRKAGRMWNRYAHYFGRSPDSPMPPIYMFDGLLSQHHIRGMVNRYRNGRRQLWLDRGLARRLVEGRRGSQRGKKTLVHEWVHYFQRDSVLRMKEPWLKEGGAEAFARRVVPGGEEMPFGWKYEPYTERVIREKGWPWIMRGQFRARGGLVPAYARGGVISGRVTYFGGGETAGGSHTSRPGLALNLDTSDEPGGWDNERTRGWMEASRAGDPVYARVTVAGKSANLPITDVGPASWTGNSIDITEGGLRKLGFEKPYEQNFPSGTIAKAVILGGRDKESEKERREKTPVHGRTKLSYEEKVSKVDTRIAKAETTATLRDDRRAATAKLDLMRRRKRHLEKKLRGIDKRLKGKLKPPVRERLLQEREGIYSELSSIPGEASGLIESLREAGLNNSELHERAKGFGVGIHGSDRPTAADRADLRLARAERTPAKEDDIEALKELRDIAKRQLKAAKRTGDPRKIAEATRNLTQAAQALREATPTREDYVNRDLALAELTEGIDDDRAALEALKAIRQEELAAALRTADPRDDIEAAQALKSTTEALKSLEETISGIEQQRQDLERERLEVDKRLAALAERGDPALAAQLIAWVEGMMGGPIQNRERLAIPGIPAAYQ